MRCEPDRLLNNAAKGVTGVTPFVIWWRWVADRHLLVGDPVCAEPVTRVGGVAGRAVAIGFAA